MPRAKKTGPARKRKRGKKIAAIATPEVAARNPFALVKWEPRPRTRRQIVEAVCQRVVGGGRVHAACRLEGIHWRDMWLWMANDPDLHALYARARKASAYAWEDRATAAVQKITDQTTPQAARIIEDNARWRARMADPKNFGDRIELDGSVDIGLEQLVAGSMKIGKGS